MAKAKDPVCGMEVDTETAPRTVHKGKTYYFCPRACEDALQKEPEKYVEEK